jgi:hypothetical protein
MAIFRHEGPVLQPARSLDDVVKSVKPIGTEWKVEEVPVELRVNPDKPGRMATCKVTENQLQGGIAIIALENARLPRHCNRPSPDKNYAMMAGTYAQRIFTMGGMLHDQVLSPHDTDTLPIIHYQEMAPILHGNMNFWHQPGTAPDGFWYGIIQDVFPRETAKQPEPAAASVTAP